MPIVDAVQNIFAICVIKPGPPFRVVEFRGTGFFVRPNGYFLTAQHVLDRNLGPREEYCIIIELPHGSGTLRKYRVLAFERESNGFDVAIGRAEFNNRHCLSIAKSELSLGEGVYSYGFALPEGERRPDGYKDWKLNPRYFQGYVTRAFPYQHHGYRSTPTYELSFPAPEGLSGSPLLINGTHTAAGLIYGNLESYTIAAEQEVEKPTGKVITETRRIIQFGLAHFHTTLLNFRSSLLDGKAIGEWQP